MFVTKNEPLCSRVSSFCYHFIIQSSWTSLQMNTIISFTVIMPCFHFAFRKHLEPYRILPNLCTFLYLFSASLHDVAPLAQEKKHSKQP